MVEYDVTVAGLVAYVEETLFENDWRKFEADDVHEDGTLYDAAIEWLRTYQGTFEFLIEMQLTYSKFRNLSDGQAKGVLNCLRAELNRTRRRDAQTMQPGAAKRSVQATIVEDEVRTVVEKGTYTIVMPDNGKHATLRVKPVEWGDFPAGTMVVQYLNGPDNEGDFTGFAFINPQGQAKIWSKFQKSDRLAFALGILMTADFNARVGFGEAYALRSNKCWRCGRTLTVPASISRGLGPECAKIVGM